MKDSIFRAYENYAVKGKSVEEGLKSLIEGSDSYNYLKSIDILTKKGINMSEDDMSFLENYIKNSNTVDSHKIELKLLMLQYDSAKNKKEKDKILNKINTKYLHTSFEHERPFNLNTSTEESKINESKTIDQGNLLDEVDVSGELEKLYSGELMPNSFSKSVLVNAELDKLSKDSFKKLINYMDKDIFMLDENPQFYKSIGK